MVSLAGGSTRGALGIFARRILAWEREQATRHEYFRGEAFAMAGGSPRHNVLCSRLNMALLTALGSRGCYVFSSDQRIALPADRYVYPDLSATCGGIVLEVGTTDVITNPNIVVEVLSSSTEPYDRGLKWEGYQGIPSLSDYVLVSQSEPRIEHFRREPSGSWLYRAVGPGDRVVLGLGPVLEVDAIFAGVFEIAGE